ncbi:MAG TPA: hypothetical protein VGC67_17580 [Cellulomonas sp.]
MSPPPSGFRAAARRAYEAALVVLLAAAGLGGIATAVLAPAVTRALTIAQPGRLAVVAGLAVAGTVLIALGRVGPIWLTAAEHQWHDLPTLLRRRRRAVRVAGAALALTGALVTAAAVPGGPWVAVPAAMAAAVVIALAAAVVALGQRQDRAALVGTVGLVLAAASIGLAGLLSGRGTVPLLAVALALTAALALRAPSSVRVTGPGHPRPAPPRWELRRAGAVVEALAMSTVMLDGTPPLAAQDAQLAPRRRRLTVPAPLRPLARLLSSSRVVDLLVTVAVPAAVLAAAGQVAAVGCLLVLTTLFSRPVTRLLDTWADSPALARTFRTGRRPSLGTVLAATSLVLVLGYASLGCALAGLDGTWGPVAAALAALVWARRLSGRRLGTRVGALISTPAGAIPVDLARRVLAGPDVLVLGLLVLAHLPATLALTLVVVVAAAVTYPLGRAAGGR